MCLSFSFCIPCHLPLIVCIRAGRFNCCFTSQAFQFSFGDNQQSSSTKFTSWRCRLDCKSHYFLWYFTIPHHMITQSKHYKGEKYLWKYTRLFNALCQITYLLESSTNSHFDWFNSSWNGTQRCTFFTTTWWYQVKSPQLIFSQYFCYVDTNSINSANCIMVKYIRKADMAYTFIGIYFHFVMFD